MNHVILKFIDQLVHKISKEIKMRLWFLFKQYNTSSDSREIYPEIDVLMPLLEKDLAIASRSIKSILKYSLNPVSNIYIVAPNNDLIIAFCKENNLNFISEDEISPLNSGEISSYTKSDSRIGWLKQQLIKLNCFNILGIKQYVLVMDADTVLTKEQFFCKNDGSIILFFSDEFHFYYRMSNKFLLDRYNFYPFSFISHHQIFNVNHLQSLTDLLEKKHGCKWYYSFLNAANKFDNYVSEYELYAQFVSQSVELKYIPQYWFNYNLKFNNYIENNKLNERALSVSYHNYS